VVIFVDAVVVLQECLALCPRRSVTPSLDTSMSHRVTVEDCARFNVQRELFRTRRLRFDAMTEGTWRGLTWRTLLSPSGSFIESLGSPLGAGAVGVLF
jgi:hypothetical protein